MRIEDSISKSLSTFQQMSLSAMNFQEGSWKSTCELISRLRRLSPGDKLPVQSACLVMSWRLAFLGSLSSRSSWWGMWLLSRKSSQSCHSQCRAHRRGACEQHACHRRIFCPVSEGVCPNSGFRTNSGFVSTILAGANASHLAQFCCLIRLN